MNTELRVLHERNGDSYDFDLMLETRERTRGVIRDVAAQIGPGMTEEDALALMRQTLKARDMLRGWHGIHVRFGSNTLKTFGKPSEPGVVLRENDIFFIDIGPVWRGYEGDGGETFTVGSDPEMLKAAADVRAVFDTVRDAWLREGLTGAELYRHAQAQAAFIACAYGGGHQPAPPHRGSYRRGCRG